MSHLQRLKQKYKTQSANRKKRQKIVFSVFFCLTVALSAVMLIICCFHRQMPLWVEIVFTAVWNTFTLFFAYGIKRKWWFFSEEGYYVHVTGWVNAQNAWGGSIRLFVISLIISVGFVIHLTVRLLI